MRLVVGLIAVCMLMLAATVWLLVEHPSASRRGVVTEPIVAAPRAERMPAAEPERAALSSDAAESGPAPSSIHAESPRVDATGTLPNEAAIVDRGASGEADAPAASSPTVVEQSALRPTTEPAPAAIQWARDRDRAAARERLALAREALRADPYHETALRDELAALVALQAWPDAARTLARLLELHPDDAELRFEYAAVLLRLQRYIEAIDALNTVVRQQPGHTRAWFNLAGAHQAVGHLQEAIRAWDRAIELEPSAVAYAQRGAAALDLGLWTEAIADFERVLELEPGAADATLNLAWALSGAGRAEQARTMLRGFVEQHTQHVAALNRLARITWELSLATPGKAETLRAEVVDLCRRVLVIDPEQPDAQALLEAAERRP